MEFGTPWALLGLLLIPLLVLRVLRPGGAGAVRFSSLGAAARREASPRVLAAAVVPWLKIAAFALLIIALARPQGHGVPERQTAEGVDIMLTLDLSGSMLAEDFTPKNRLTVAKETLEQFALQTENDRLGLVVFAGKAFTQSPLTLDREMVADLIRQVEYGMIEDGTAIGMAIATAAHRLRQSDAKSRVIVLMTDGVNNAGKIDPITAARAAAALGIRVYTVGVGREGGAPIAIEDGIFGTQYLRNPDGSLMMADIDEESLREIARITGGRFFRAADADAMARVYAEIRKLEKSPFEATARRPVVEEFERYLWPALALLMAAFLLDGTIGRRAP